MTRRLWVSSFLFAIAACSTRQDADPLQDGGQIPDDTSPIDASPSDASPSDAGLPDAERPLVCGDAGFCETRLPTTSFGIPLSLRAVWAVASNDVWSVSIEGFILHYDGASWTTVYEANHALHAVWATSSDVWVGGEAGLLLHKAGHGTFVRIETNHLATIRSIYGTSVSDVWFTGGGSSVDHYDGDKLTNLSIDVPGFRLTRIFGRAGVGTFAAGYVKGPPLQPDALLVEHVPRLFSLTPTSITPFNTSLQAVKGFVPLSGVVEEGTEAAPRVWLFGYSDAGLSLSLKYSLVGQADPVALSDMPYLSIYDLGGNPTPPPLPAWSAGGGNIYIPYAIGRIVHFAGATYSQKSLSMGYSFVPKAIYGIHGSGSDAWIVGDSFALKGVAP